MRAVIQRVLSASVVVEGKEISRIGRGLMCLIGISSHDAPSDLEYIVKKILSLKLFPLGEEEAQQKQWAQSVTDVYGEVLCVSQFTLYASTKKGAKPDFHAAMGSGKSKDFYTTFLRRMGEDYDKSKILDGEFGAMMNVSLTNEGPVTIVIDSNDTRSSSTANTSGTSTPIPGETARKSGNSSAERQQYLAEKQRKREDQQKRQQANLEKKKNDHLSQKANEETDPA